ncbi:hypothetical protein C8J57DRAFT_1659806 [Mycena rebaudengoi]|nr:hypothetical protein C8J57DRAFT_1659806 [Mycena rebaudengoi]
MSSFTERYLPRLVEETEIDELSSREYFWRDYRPWLAERGYLLRPRYQPDWVPSWKTTRTQEWAAEDKQRPNWPDNQWVHLLDATRISDKSHVMLKVCDPERHPQEVKITQFFSSELFVADPRNHCVPVYEAMSVPELTSTIILVMPLLYTMESPQFDTIGEAVECFRQIFDGVQFLDCKYDSFMVDSKALYSHPPHPWSPKKRRDFKGPPRTMSTRTRTPVKYFMIDFGLSRRYEDVGPHLELPGWGGDKTVPEFRTGELCDPFLVDVYCLGNVVREYFTQGSKYEPGKKGFDFMKELVDDMCQDDPQARPKMTEVVTRFEKIRLGLNEWKVRSRIVKRNENFVAGLFRSVFHWAGQVVPICQRIPPTPVAQ